MNSGQQAKDPPLPSPPLGAAAVGAAPASVARVRHVEKRRTATCAFADRVARISLDRYCSAVPASFRLYEQPQTVVAAIVAQFRTIQPPDEDADGGRHHLRDGHAVDQDTSTAAPNIEEGEDNSRPARPGEDELEVVALGVGTKFLNEATIRSLSSPGRQGLRNPPPGPSSVLVEATATAVPESVSTVAEAAATTTRTSTLEPMYGDRVRDCHAEVLARRAFRRHLSLEILHDLQGLRDEGGGGGVGGSRPRRRSLLERVPAAPVETAGNDDNRRLCLPRFVLRKGVTLHLYCSSAPCGNAVLKKFCTPRKETFVRDLPDHEWPVPPHPSMIPGHSKQLGQFVLLCKKDNSSTRHPTSADMEQESPITITSPSLLPWGCPLLLRGKEAAWRCHQTDTWCPKGTTIVTSGAGSLHTCSDKIARWNVLGIQGSVLAPFLDRPLYLSTVVVGRKFSSITCRRAVCCRLGNQGEARSAETITSVAGAGTSTSLCRRRGSEARLLPSSPYRLQHPAVLGTGVYMDERGVIDMSSSTASTAGNDVRFHSSKSWAWWPGLEDAECIDGSTGLLLRQSSSTDESSHSLISTAALVSIACQIQALSQAASSNLPDADTVTDDALLGTLVNPTQSLRSLRQFKQQHSPEYEEMKEVLLTRHSVLRLWKRRSTQ